MATVQAKKIELKARHLFLASPEQGVAMQANAYATTLQGNKLLSFHTHLLISDTMHATWTRFSEDSGVTWSEAEPWHTWEKQDEGTLRRHYRSGYVDAASGRFILFRNEALMPNDDVDEWQTHATLHYAVSFDEGRTFPVDEQIIDHRPGHDAAHPLPRVWRGHNTAMLGDWSCLPITLSDGSLLLAPSITPVDDNRKYINPGGGYTYHDVGLLRGEWRADGGLRWEQIATVCGDPARSTRGMDEATLGLLADGRILMVMRGSNDVKRTVQGYRWYSISADNGYTWSEPAPWVYTNGLPFHSPSSCSQLLQHSSGALFWLGNICPDNPYAGLPRYPFVIAQVHSETGLLMQKTATIVDDREPHEAVGTMFSNFYAREDVITGEIVLHMSRLYTKPKPGDEFHFDSWHPEMLDFTSDAYEYRLRVGDA